MLKMSLQKSINSPETKYHKIVHQHKEMERIGKKKLCSITSKVAICMVRDEGAGRGQETT